MGLPICLQATTLAIFDQPPTFLYGVDPGQRDCRPAPECNVRTGACAINHYTLGKACGGFRARQAGNRVIIIDLIEGD